MSIGMTYDEYWYGDPRRFKFYRKANELSIKRKNEELWLQGAYNFQAFATALSNLSFDKKKHKVNNYLEKPFDLFAKTEEEKKDEVQDARQKVIDHFNALKKAFDEKKKGQT